jgi:hypothetical protein
MVVCCWFLVTWYWLLIPRYSLRTDELVKSRISIKFVIPANPGSSPGQASESSFFKMFWTPAFAGVTIQETFYETSKNWMPDKTAFLLPINCRLP